MSGTRQLGPQEEVEGDHPTARQVRVVAREHLVDVVPEAPDEDRHVIRDEAGEVRVGATVLRHDDASPHRHVRHTRWHPR